MSPQVSIVVPVYNVQAYLAACLDSILAQTTKDFEVICVEDCSTDGSPSILQSYSQRDPRIRVISHERNSGLSAARNTGIDESRGEWVLFVDSDDVVSRTLCERTLAAAKEMQADVVFYGHATFRDGELPPGEPARAKPVLADRRALLTRQAFAWTKMVRRDLLIARNIRFPVGLCFEDVPVHWRLTLESVAPVFLDEALVWYRQRAGSITYRTDWSRADGLKIYDLVREWLCNSGHRDTYGDIFLQAELANFANTYAYYAIANNTLVGRVRKAVRRRMTSAHWVASLSGVALLGWQRDYILSRCIPDGVPWSPCILLPSLRHALRVPLRRLRHLLR